MRALCFDGTRAALLDVPRPEVDDASALVRVSLAGVCNTDIELLKGYMGFRGVLGHEFVGTVAEGPPSLLGERVVGEINFACGSCADCSAGLGRHCPTRDVMGILRADGAFAEFVRVPIANLHPVPASVPDELAVFAEPLAAAFEILEQVRVEPGTDCIVLGDGKLGLLAAQVLHAAGADVLAVGRHPAKLAVLGKRGIRTAVASDALLGPASLVVEATGSALGFARAVAALRPRGTLVLKSTHAEQPTVDLAPLVIHELHVIGSRCGPFPPALRALETGAVDVRSLVHARLPLSRAEEALRTAAEPGALKVLIEVNPA
jgi:threonine dehydrogenase-like Zn-dependent dehydrogenase